MKRIIVWSLLILASNQICAEEIRARVIFNKKENITIAIITDTKNKSKQEKCEELIRSKEGQNILKKQSDKMNKKLVELIFICNL